MGRFFVVGDIHGCGRELEALLAALALVRGDTVAFIGDYIDRGLFSLNGGDLFVIQAHGD